MCGSIIYIRITGQRNDETTDLEGHEELGSCKLYIQDYFTAHKLIHNAATVTHNVGNIRSNKHMYSGTSANKKP